MKKKYSKSKKTVIVLVCILFIESIVLFHIGNRYDFTHSILVSTKNQVDNSVNYYEVNDKGKNRETLGFEPDKMEVFTVENCYRSYISGNKVLNRLTLDTCVIKDDTGNPVIITEELKKIVTNVASLEHDIIRNRILRIDNEYYVVVELNVNLWSPYELYYYDKVNNKLVHQYTFSGEDIVGLKIK